MSIYFHKIRTGYPKNKIHFEKCPSGKYLLGVAVFGRAISIFI